MATRLSALFLLLLLVCDWIGDPYFGQSSLSHPLSNQEVSCSSLSCCKGSRVTALPAGGTDRGMPASTDGWPTPPSRTAVYQQFADPFNTRPLSSAATPLRC
jgi:hypothetical protein